MFRMFTLFCCWFAFSALAQPPFPAGGKPPSAARDTDELLARAQTQAARRVELAGRLGARIERSGDGRSFALVWQPKTAPAGWIFTLHGSGSWAYDEIALWQPFAERHNLGVVALQWWLGGGHRSEDYYRPTDIRRELDRLAATVGAVPEHILLHGFSRASANLYALVAFDARQPRPLFRHVVANAGGMAADYPANRDIEARGRGAKPYAGTRWWLYCGGSDPNPERDGCPAMRRSRDWLEGLGATAVLNEDAAGDHGGFHRRGANVEQALGWFLGQ